MANETKADVKGQQSPTRPTAKQRYFVMSARWIDYLAQRAETWASPNAPQPMTASQLLTEAQAGAAVLDYLAKLRDFAAKE